MWTSIKLNIILEYFFIFHSAASSLVSRSTTTLVVLVALVLQQDHHVAENVHEVDEQHDLTRRGTIEGSFTTVCYYASVRPVVNGGLMGGHALL